MTLRTLPLAALLATTALPAWAQLTAEGLWADWQATAERFGATLEAAEEEAGDGALVLRDVTLGFDATIEGEEGSFSTTYEEVTLTEEAGAVLVTMPEITETVTRSSVGGEETVDRATLTQVDAVTRVTEVDGARRYVSEAAEFVSEGTTEADEADGTPALRQRFALTGLESTTVLDADGPGSVTTDGSADGVSVAVSDLAGETFSVAYEGEGLSLSGGGTLPDGGAEDALAAMNALDLSLEYVLAPASFTAASQVEGGAFTASGTTGESSTSIAFGEDGIRYEGSLDGMTLEVRPKPIPVPFSGSLEESSFALTLPTRATPEAQRYGLSMALAGVELSDAVWGLFDPEGQLPREPATIRLGLSGDMRVTQDVFSEEAVASPTPPFEPQSLDVDALEIMAAGASITGTGALTFPVLVPQPQPVGEISLRAEGLFDLLDGLVALGVVPADQATFARGMAGVVARPTGDGGLESTIEFTEGGGIVANGLPLR